MSAIVFPPNFSLKEMTFSETASRKGIKNECPENLIANVAMTAEWLQVLRERLVIEKGRQMPIRVLSGFRSPEVNKLVGGSDTSAHRFGLAADFYVPGMSVDELFEFVRKNMKSEGWDQLIHEFGEWVHVGFAIGRERGECLKATKKPQPWPLKAKTVYTKV